MHRALAGSPLLLTSFCPHARASLTFFIQLERFLSRNPLDRIERVLCEETCNRRSLKKESRSDELQCLKQWIIGI